MQNWLPLSEAVLSMVDEKLPDPKRAAAEKIKALLPVEYQETQAAQLPQDVQQVTRYSAGCSLATRGFLLEI